MQNNFVEFLIPIIGLNLSLIIINRVLWLQILIMGTLVAEVSAILIYSNMEILGISMLIIYNGALLVLFTLAFLLVIPTRIRPAKDATSWWVISVIFLVSLLATVEAIRTEAEQLNYTRWSGTWENELIALNIGLYDRYNQEFLGTALLLLIGVFATLKILKN